MCCSLCGLSSLLVPPLTLPLRLQYEPIPSRHTSPLPPRLPFSSVYTIPCFLLFSLSPSLTSFHSPLPSPTFLIVLSLSLSLSLIHFPRSPTHHNSPLKCVSFRWKPFFLFSLTNLISIYISNPYFSSWSHSTLRLFFFPLSLFKTLLSFPHFSLFSLSCLSLTTPSSLGLYKPLTHTRARAHKLSFVLPSLTLAFSFIYSFPSCFSIFLPNFYRFINSRP